MENEDILSPQSLVVKLIQDSIKTLFESNREIVRTLEADRININNQIAALDSKMDSFIHSSVSRATCEHCSKQFVRKDVMYTILGVISVTFTAVFTILAALSDFSAIAKLFAH